MKRIWLTLLISAATLFAADVTGEWKATAEGPNGPMERTFSLKVEGTKLTGETISSFVGKSVIENGKAEGDQLSFTIKAKFQDNEMVLTYKGKVVSADEIQFTSGMGDGGQSIEWVAKRAK